MTYDQKLTDRIRAYLADVSGLDIEEKESFRGITFMVNGKMCFCVSGDEMMVVLILHCRTPLPSS